MARASAADAVLRRQHYLLRRPHPGNRRATSARILSAAGEDFAILGAAEKDSGHDVRRFGEEMLFMALRDHNTDAIKASGVKRIVTSDPHAFNALKHDYKDMPPVEHISQLIAREVKSGKLQLNPVEERRQRSTPITIPAISAGTTRCTTIRAMCWMRFPV
jgi:Fe-S oxidoreductase